MVSKLWLLICVTQFVIINCTYDSAYGGIKTRAYHRGYTNSESQNSQTQPNPDPYSGTNSYPYDTRPTSSYGSSTAHGDTSMRLSPSDAHQYHNTPSTQLLPPHKHPHQQEQQQQQQHVHAYQQQRESPIYDRNSHVHHSAPLSAVGAENSLPDFHTGCPPQHTGPVPYPYDCRRFVNCWHGRGHIQSCGVGTVFNPQTLECDRPDKVVCGNPNVNGGEEPNSPPNEPYQNKYRAGRLLDASASNNGAQNLCPPGASGLSPHPTDCTKFLNCANGEAHVQSCGPGTAYSVTMKVCDFKDKVDCSGREGSVYGSLQNREGRQYDVIACPAGLNGLYPHPYDCKKYLNCAHSQMVVQSCGPGTAFDRSKLLCDFQEKVGCATTRKSTFEATSTHNYQSTTISGNGLQEEEEPNIFCPPGVTGLFPYPFDYTKFLNCKRGNTAIQNCLPGTVYSISKNYCEQKENVPHSDHVAYIVSEVRYEYSMSMINCPPSTDGIHLYPYDPMKYIKCQQEQMSIIACPPNTQFCLSTKTCRPVNEVKFGDRVRNAVEASYSTDIRDSQSSALNYLDHQRLECPRGQAGLYPHPFDCNKYLQCRNGKLTIETCSPGYVFSLSSKHCDPKEIVDAKQKVQFQLDFEQNRTPKSDYDYRTIQLTCPPNMNGYFLHPFDCTKYLLCHDGQSQVESCESGKVFSISRRECINRNQVDAYDRVEYESEVKHEFSTEFEQRNPTPSIESLCSSGAKGPFPHPYDNTRYVKCNNGQAKVESCTGGMIFSKVRRYCDYESKVLEYDRGDEGFNRRTESGGSQTTVFGYDSGSIGYDNTNYNDNGGRGPKTVHDERRPPTLNDGGRIECPPKSVGMHPHPYDCKKFLECSNGVTHVKNCGPGTAWSVDMEVCDFEANVNCADRTTRLTYPSDATNMIRDNKVECPTNAKGLYLHPFDARKFISCNGGETYVQTCQSGSVFSISKRMCQSVDEANTLDYVQSAQDYTREISLHYNYIACPAQAIGYFIYPFDGLLYIHCNGGQTMIQNCSPETLFSIANKICIPVGEAQSNDHIWLGGSGGQSANSYGSYDQKREWSAAVASTSVNSHTLNSEHYAATITCPRDTGLYPHPRDCTKFVRCASGISHIQDCGPGTAFDATLEVCDFIEKVDCGGRQLFTAAGIRDSRTQSVTCPKGASGIYPHPFDCKKFLNCDNGVANVQDCGPGTAWNAKMEVCDFEEKVECSQSGGRSAGTFKDNPAHGFDTNTNLSPSLQPPEPSYSSGSTSHISRSDSTARAYNPNTNLSPTFQLPEPSYNSGSTSHISRSDSSARGYNTNTNLSPTLQPPEPSYNNQYGTTYGSTGYGTITSHSHTNTYGDDRWSNMDRQRPIPSDSVYRPEQAHTSVYDHHHRLPTSGRGLSDTSSGSWAGTGTAISRQTPTQSVIYEEGSLEPNRNYNTINTITSSPSNSDDSTFTASVNRNVIANATTNLVFAQPVGSEENTDEVFDSNEPSSPLNRNENDYESPASKWIPIPNQQLLPPKRTNEPVNGLNGLQPQSPPSRVAQSPQLLGYTTPPPPQNTFDSSNLYGGLQPPPPPTTPTTPLNSLPHVSSKDHPSGRTHPTGRSIDPVEPVRAFSTNVNGQPHLLSSPSSTNIYQTKSFPNTPATYLQPPTMPTPAARTHSVAVPSTRLKKVDPLLEHTTIATFSKDPHYSNSYSNVAHSNPSQPAEPQDLEDIQKSEDLAAMSDALRLLLRPYFNRSGTISEISAERTESHIMKLAPNLPHPSIKTSSSTSEIQNKNPSTGSNNETEVELILAGEQHSLTTVSTSSTQHDSQRESYSKNTKQESKLNTNWHNHGHNREFHRTHPNLLNPFAENEYSSSNPPSHHHHHHHHGSHNKAYHQRHPEMPNPFEASESTTEPRTYPQNPYAESTTPFSVRPQLDLGSNFDCQFDCGNGKCVKSFEVCNGINNCGNRKDEEDCKHLGYEVRLTGGESANMGRVEVKILGKWGYVCDDKFGLSDAEVVCRELGFKLGASEVRGYSYYPPTDADVSFAMDEVECRGDESSLKECTFKGWGVSNCGPDEVVGVVCKVPQLKCPNNYWLCSTSQECIPPAFVCDNTPDCADKSDESDNVCNSPVKYRLEGGRSPKEGRLEVRYRGEWGTVCDDDFGLKETQVLCNSMGLYGLPTIQKNKYGPGSGPIWLDQVSCFGNETSLDECNHWTWGEHNCNHTEDVGLKCTEGVRPQKLNTHTPHSPNQHERELEDDDDTQQQQLEDIGIFPDEWERKSKAIDGHQQRRCGHFKDNIIDEYAHPEERVVNGSLAKRGHHPWQATIRTRGRGGISSHWCGAVLISSRHLLTAAHCLSGYPKGAYLIRLGDHYANIAESSEIDSFIENWYVHEKFRDATHMNNDIALIVLKTPVKFNDYIQPVCLPSKGATITESRKCTISGWGSIKSGVSTPSNILRAAELPILPDEVCKQSHVYGASLTEGMFCAGYMDESVDACDGDSGGPLICHDEDGETLYGIISWGQHCGYANKPGVYVRVEKYVDWIMEKINFSMKNSS